MKVTLGGDRLGSGNKNKIALRNYERSTHNLSQKFTSSMQCGTLYPFLCIPAMRGDKFEISLDADCRTIPTKGPLFGSFKMQIDLFQCDVRLYQAILHNNPLAIGLNMSQVKFPQLYMTDSNKPIAFSNSSLMKYLGVSGLGHNIANTGLTKRYINAIPALAYYEIFKTYYSNKQEEKAYIIGTEKQYIETLGESIYYSRVLEEIEEEAIEISEEPTENTENSYLEEGVNTIFIKANFEHKNNKWLDVLNINFLYYNNDLETYTIVNSYNLGDLFREKKLKYTGSNDVYTMSYMSINANQIPNKISFTTSQENPNGMYLEEFRGLQSFDLANIDEMRLKLLSYHTLGNSFKIKNQEAAGDNGFWGYDDGKDGTGLPYINLVDLNSLGYSKNSDALNGLVVKTYQSDLFNNWVNTEWIDGENGIANVTAISTASGSIKIDSLNLSEKLYNMLNRIAVSDGSYEGWQDAVYTETPKRHIESPVYLGGMSNEIMFEAIVQTAPTEDSALGTLAGKGVLVKNKGGHVTVKCNEACFIIGIVSLTPRVNYSQGNEFYMTDLMSMDDFHKPALDGIGFQNLIGERMAWWDTEIDGDTIIGRSAIGKVPAWIEYMTAVDRTFGDFAETEGRGFMALNREYGRTNDNKIQDATTYIDPRKYNYAFAYTDIDAQNFWVQIYSKITARRLMSAKQIPNI